MDDNKTAGEASEPHSITDLTAELLARVKRASGAQDTPQVAKKLKTRAPRSAPIKSTPRRPSSTRRRLTPDELAEARRKSGRLGAIARALRQMEPLDELEPDPDLLPLGSWIEEVRGMPNVFLRGCLFTATQPPDKGEQRPYLENVQLPTLEKSRFELFYTGPLLCQSDADGWMACVHLIRNRAVGRTIQFTGREFLRAAGKGRSKRDFAWMEEVLIRLAGAVVHVYSHGQLVAWGPLIKGGTRDPETDLFTVEVDESYAALYAYDQWTGLNFEERKLLHNAPLAQWLHGFYSTHAKTRDVNVEQLRELCGTVMKPAEFRRKLRAAIEKLQRILGWTAEWSTNSRGECVAVRRKVSAAQARHNARGGAIQPLDSPDEGI